MILSIVRTLYSTGSAPKAHVYLTGGFYFGGNFASLFRVLLRMVHVMRCRGLPDLAKRGHSDLLCANPAAADSPASVDLRRLSVTCLCAYRYIDRVSVTVVVYIKN